MHSSTMSLVIQELIDTAAKDLASKLDNEIRGALNEEFPGWESWSLSEIKQRCSIVRFEGNPIETFCCDGKALLEIHPIESSQERTDVSYIIRYTRNIRRLRS